MIFVHPLWSIILLNYLTSYCYSVVSVICKGFELYRIPPCGRFWERLVFGSSSHEYLITDVNETERRISRQLLDWSKREKLTSARRETRLSRGFCATTRGWSGGRRWGNLWSLSWASGSRIRNARDADADMRRVLNTSLFVRLCQVRVGNLNAGFATDRIHNRLCMSNLHLEDIKIT